MVPNICYEDAHILICHKESGVPVQTAKLTEPDLESILKNYLAAVTKEKRPYLGLVHRLDQPVEGILVFAKTPFAAKELSKQAAGKTMRKFYHAITQQPLREQKGILTDHLIKNSRTNMAEVVTADISGGKCAKLSYTFLRQTEMGYLYEIELLTGRFHQIRVQLSHAGAPIVGDRKYGAQNQVGHKLFLCAYKLIFMHPQTKKECIYEIKGYA